MLRRLFLSWLLIFIAASAFAQSPEEAREELKNSGYYFSAGEFIEAVRVNDFRAVDLFLRGGMSANVKDATSMTPLMYAAQNGYTLIVQTLLEKGANVNARQNGDESMTPLLFAVRQDYPKIAEILLENGADPNVIEGDGMTPLMYAAQDGNADIVKELLLAGADIEAQADNGWTPLIFASEGGYTDIVRALLKAGVDVNAGPEGETAVEHARRARRQDIIRILEEAGAE